MYFVVLAWLHMKREGKGFKFFVIIDRLEIKALKVAYKKEMRKWNFRQVGYFADMISRES